MPQFKEPQLEGELSFLATAKKDKKTLEKKAIKSPDLSRMRQIKLDSKTVIFKKK